eukprot:7774102-Pyramimonas_sp.AAC.1
MQLIRSRLACIQDLNWKHGPNLKQQKVPKSAKTRRLREAEMSPHSVIKGGGTTSCTRCAAFSVLPSPGWVTQGWCSVPSVGGGLLPEPPNFQVLARSQQVRGSKRLVGCCRDRSPKGFSNGPWDNLPI